MMKRIEEKVEAVYHILSHVYQESPWTKEQIKTDLESPNVDYFFVYDKQKIIGFLSLQQLVGELEITNIAVLPDYQGKGFGAQLLQKVTSSNQTLFLEVRESNLAAQALYKKVNFSIVGKRKNYYKNPVEGALLMKREGRNDR
ncbi:ribosomal protein S18-alanine N-acetyltransferase [Streptococcus pseudoporcinus]|uniref:[Ribosomal protein bS18]-alanine N-acetyltransferase n=2 Tax=Streptococcus pseudoporcinus TaxID=361101 RepID=G5K8C4_9STRE|nr:ribosomal protein S18-alanine N-acetyltransferase [Streptococcus pseudoporcinus]EFR44900.1 ribosomal-protein-alanine acetyltransferase [Streptococcus pseudoporcinus SPIN 20026]EHI64649.1 ribosomal-protein-alanine acetyltransferase [Streptococcus pseudoporcinus LQ 940-04]VEF94068.1 GNAT family acetyltransferase [Streptococcus pseudoporcinus]VTS23516.1 GNAT family acetyltransferase [Streptococcus pseudoporcinus]VUC70704.1 GNAT family acetyltransferase [Streptococcus pseudoporcinus]